MKQKRFPGMLPLAFVMAAVLAQIPQRARADSNNAATAEPPPLAPPAVEENPEPALTIDNWVPKQTPPPAPAEAEPVAAPPSAPPVSTRPEGTGVTDSKKNVPANLPGLVEPKTAVPPTPTPPAPPRIAMNEMTGTLTSIDAEERTIRLTVAGGISPQLAFDETTVVIFRGRPLKISDLKPGDPVVARYIGQDLTAREIEKLPSKN